MVKVYWAWCNRSTAAYFDYIYYHYCYCYQKKLFNEIISMWNTVYTHCCLLQSRDQCVID